jgi:hypothetical protein
VRDSRSDWLGVQLTPVLPLSPHGANLESLTRTLDLLLPHGSALLGENHIDPTGLYTVDQQTQARCLHGSFLSLFLSTWIQIKQYFSRAAPSNSPKSIGDGRILRPITVVGLVGLGGLGGLFAASLARICV